jgi:hypothetical protein
MALGWAGLGAWLYNGENNGRAMTYIRFFSDRLRNFIGGSFM